MAHPFIILNGNSKTVIRRGAKKMHQNRVGKIIERFTCRDTNHQYRCICVQWRDFAENFVTSKKRISEK